MPKCRLHQCHIHPQADSECQNHGIRPCALLLPINRFSEADPVVIDGEQVQLRRQRDRHLHLLRPPQRTRN